MPKTTVLLRDQLVCFFLCQGGLDFAKGELLVFRLGAALQFVILGVKVELFPAVAEFTAERIRAILTVLFDSRRVLPLRTHLRNLVREKRPLKVLPVMCVNASVGIVTLPRVRAELALETEEHEVGINREQVQRFYPEVRVAVGKGAGVSVFAVSRDEKFSAVLLFVERGVVLFLDDVVRELAIFFCAVFLAPSRGISKPAERTPLIALRVEIQTGLRAMASALSVAR